MTNSKLLQYLGLFFAIVVILLFLDFALGAFLEGWRNPK